MAKHWKKEDVAYLRRYARAKRVEELASRFKTDAAAVRAKLHELGLTPKGGARASGDTDPTLAQYERALKALSKQDWEGAHKLLAQVEKNFEQPEVQSRARIYLAICDNRIAEQDAKAADPYLQAVFEKNRGNYDAALEICSRGGRRSKDEGFAYLAASVYALKQDFEAAAQSLGLAIELEPKNRVHAFHDPDFEELRVQAEHSHLFTPG